MKVITNRKIVHSNVCGCGSDHSSFTGAFDTKNPSHVKEFQVFAIGAGYIDADKKALVADGKWGPKTQAAFNKIGSAFKEANSGIKNGSLPLDNTGAPLSTAKKPKGAGLLDTAKNVLGFLTPSSTPANTGGNTTDTSVQAIDPTTGQPVPTGMSTTKKVLIGLCIAAAAGAGIYFATRKKK